MNIKNRTHRVAARNIPAPVAKAFGFIPVEPHTWAEEEMVRQGMTIGTVSRPSAQVVFKGNIYMVVMVSVGFDDFMDEIVCREADVVVIED